MVVRRQARPRRPRHQLRVIDAPQPAAVEEAPYRCGFAGFDYIGETRGRVGPEKRFVQVPNGLFDDLLPQMGYAELKVLMAFVRLTFGYGKITDSVAVRRLVGLTGLSQESAWLGIKQCLERGTIERIGAGKKGMGIFRIRVNPETASMAWPDSIEDRAAYPHGLEAATDGEDGSEEETGGDCADRSARPNGDSSTSPNGESPEACGLGEQQNTYLNTGCTHNSGSVSAGAPTEPSASKLADSYAAAEKRTVVSVYVQTHSLDLSEVTEHRLADLMQMERQYGERVTIQAIRECPGKQSMFYIRARAERIAQHLGIGSI